MSTTHQPPAESAQERSILQQNGSSQTFGPKRDAMRIDLPARTVNLRHHLETFNNLMSIELRYGD